MTLTRSLPRRLDNLSTGFKWAIRKGVKLVVGGTTDDTLLSRLIAECEVSAIIQLLSHSWSAYKEA
jgi:UDP-glucose 4-epimerase